jgi:hypothetical protein
VKLSEYARCYAAGESSLFDQFRGAVGSPTGPERNPGGAPHIPEVEINDFYTSLRSFILYQIRRPQGAKITIPLAQQHLNIHGSRWRLRIDRTYKKVGVKSWKEFLDYVLSSKT